MKLTKIALLVACMLYLTACSDNNAWVAYNNENFNYTVLFPEEPTVETTTIELPEGNVPSQGVSAYEHIKSGKKNLFMINCITFPNTIIKEGNTVGREALYSNVVTQLLNDLNGKLVFERAVEVAGMPARAFRIEYKSSEEESINYMTYRTFIKDNLQFVLQAITNKEEDSEASIEQFMNSFQFTEVE